MKSNALRFRPDGTFHILQVSDPQDLVHPRRAMLRMLDRAYDGLKPDLVLFTGDNTLGNHLLDVGPKRITTLHCPAITLRQMRRSLAHILEPVNRRGIPFCMIYGNHDDMNDVSKEAQYSLYRAYPMCLPMNESDPFVDCDTYSVPLLRSAGDKTAWNLYLLDSAWNDETGQYWQIKKETVAWYLDTSSRLNAENDRKNVPSLMFMHVPLPQMNRLCMPCEETHPGSVKTENGWVCLDPALASGVLGESVSAGKDPYGLFEAVRNNGDVRAVVSGHDHLNCFDGTWDGVRLIQSGAASFRCYGSRIRGVREFILNENDPAGTGFAAQLRYFWDADDKTAEKYIMVCAGSALAAAFSSPLLLKKYAIKK